MNEKKELATNIVQYIVDQLNSLERKQIIKWMFPPTQRQDYYREWGEEIMKKLCEVPPTEGCFIGHFDGSSKPNPGMMKIGGYIKDQNGKIIHKFSKNKGEGTNNKAEYLALIQLIEDASKLGIKKLQIHGDSKLAVSQVNGEWQANKDMAPYRDRALELLNFFSEWNLSHLPRKENAEADLLTR